MDNKQLQWLLIGIGAVVVVLLYLWSMRSRISEEIGKRRRRPFREPQLFGETANPAGVLPKGRDFTDPGPITPDHPLADQFLIDVEISPVKNISNKSADLEEQMAQPLGSFEPEPPEEPSGSEVGAQALTMTVALTVLAPSGQMFSGVRIQAAAEELEFRLNANGVYERFPHQEIASDTPVFSMAHLRKPGIFDPGTLPQLTTPGLLLFMSLPGPLEGTEALDLLVINADHLARNLGGVIGDEQHQRLTNPKLLQLHEQVADLERRWLAQMGG